MPHPNLQSVIEKCMPQTVAVLAPSPEHVQHLENDPNAEPAICGSGYFYTDKGYVITNFHVIEHADPRHLEVLTYDGQFHKATLVGGSKQADVAVLKIKAFPGLTPITFGNSDKLAIGQPVFAIGAPRALEFTASVGIISHPERFDKRWQHRFGDVSILPILQTDTHVNPGNSGGALFDANGHVVGMNTFILPPMVQGGMGAPIGVSLGSAGLNFALKSNDVKQTADKIIRKGATQASNPGFSLYSPNGGHRARMRYPEARVTTVESRSMAKAAGLKPGDLITHINGEPIKHGPMAEYKLFMAAGTTVDLTVERTDGDSTYKMQLSFFIPEEEITTTLPGGSGGAANSRDKDDALTEGKKPARKKRKKASD